MATRKYLTNDLSPQETPRAIEERELIIDINPRAYAAWEGTAAQLVDEGVIRKEFDWPEGRADRHWDGDDGFTYWLRRCRPAGIKGPMSVWTHGDWWMLRRTLTAERGRGCAPARLFEARRTYERELWSQTPIAHVQWTRYCMAQEHEEFQTFLKRAIGEQACTRQSRSN
jgi:hypothetical protein